VPHENGLPFKKNCFKKESKINFRYTLKKKIGKSSRYYLIKKTNNLLIRISILQKSKIGMVDLTHGFLLALFQ
jgi:hypothetical protein